MTEHEIDGLKLRAGNNGLERSELINHDDGEFENDIEG